ncbi:Mur ligase family protein [Sporosarcina sp. FA9]|uniref:Mur ligase family protein n=1 Tax=Sporosarcina sp. FA9 TaxID=3413030 RepID=UPI003F65D574
MKPLSVKQIRTIFDGELVLGSDDVLVHYGAYRLKQVKKQNTILFANKKIVNWEQLRRFLPLVLVTHQDLTQSKPLENLTVIKVKNTDEAYWRFVNYYRSLFNIPVVAITGTSGKTTTKEMIKHILLTDKKVTATNSTSNSRTAHLQYLLEIDNETEAAVFEAAVGAPGDVLNAGDYFKPTIGIITNIGAHHLGLCKTVESYIHAKGEMATILDHKGVLIINAEDINTRKIDLTNYHGRIIKVGKDSSCHFIATDINYHKDGMQFNVQFQQENHLVFVPGFGEHQVYNALSALAAVHEIGVNLQEATDRLKTFKRFNRQLQVIEGMNGSILLDDTWSMTSTSLEAALKVLTEIGEGKKKIAIIGSIKGLGPWGDIIHKQVGEMIAHRDVDILITIGILARIIASQAEESSSKLQVYAFNKTIFAYELLKEILDENTIVLIKGDMYVTSIFQLVAKIRKQQ